MTREEEADVMNIKDILKKHSKWLHGKVGGKRADLCDADLSDADLRGADLRGANLRGAKNADHIVWNVHSAFYPLQCPEKGAYTAYKKPTT